ncbi:hypothetical protein, partial [Paenibacillus aquistagni]|uniref:hypothetical protein n=1 Tax=Paenibacillus aquistagni TaxID=1852522 RepID=UPI001C6FCA6D
RGEEETASPPPRAKTSLAALKRKLHRLRRHGEAESLLLHEQAFTVSIGTSLRTDGPHLS